MAKAVASHWAGAEPTLLRRHSVRPCVGCGGCHGTGVCVFAGKDQADALLTAMLEAPALVVMAPVYFYGPPAQLKALIDRSQAVWERNGCAFSKERRPAFAVLVGARVGGERLFDASLLILRCFFDAMGFRLQDTFLQRGLDGPTDFLSSPEVQTALQHWVEARLVQEREVEAQEGQEGEVEEQHKEQGA